MSGKLFTLTGIPVEQISTRLAEPFDDPRAYKAIPGGADLTDISTGHMLERVNQVFGPKGFGWNLLFDKDDLQVFGDPTAARRIIVRLAYAVFQYTLVDDEGQPQRCEIPTSGVNTNDFAYAEEGARTSALGAALKGLGFQLPVYKGDLDHHNAAKVIGGNGKSAAGNPASSPGAGAKPGGNGHKAAVPPADPGTDAEIEDLDEPPPAGSDPGRFEIPVGRYGPSNGRPGKTLAEAPQAWVEWAAHQMQPSNEKTRLLQEAARAFLAQAQPA